MSGVGQSSTAGPVSTALASTAGAVGSPAPMVGSGVGVDVDSLSTLPKQPATSEKVTARSATFVLRIAAQHDALTMQAQSAWLAELEHDLALPNQAELVARDAFDRCGVVA